MKKKIVLNAEPMGYSEKAVQAWQHKGYSYHPSSWQEIKQKYSFPYVEVLIVRLASRVDNKVIQKFPDLKKLVSATTGHDHIDMEVLEKRAIQLVSLRGHDEFLKTIPSTAEHTWALLMALMRHIPAANEHVKKADWNRDLFRGYQLKDKTIGIIGYGRTGKKVAQYARAFEVKVKFFDPYINVGLDEKIDSLKVLMQQSDILSYHVHLNEETKNLLNRNNIQYLKKNAYLINTSRGKIWEEETVAKALEQKVISGVAVDVVSSELSDVKKSPLWQAQQNGNNVIITPHIGGATWDAMWACEEFITRLI